MHAIERQDIADTAAPLDALLIDAALGSRRFLPDASTAKLVGRLLRQPRTTGRRLGSLAAEIAKAAVGRSTIAPDTRDRRFTDPAWTQNPVLHRVLQAYLAATATAGRLVTDADLGRRDELRARVLVDNLTEALSPSNVPLVNPTSAKAAVDTAGMNFVRGGVSLLRDMVSAPRVPQMVDGSSFQIGRNIAATPGSVVLRTEQLELIQYRPQTETVRAVPILLVPPTINKYYVLDLAPGRSLVEYLVGQGLQVFVVSWRNPDARHAGWGFDTYVQAIFDALDATDRICETDKAVLFGFCSGGILSALAAAVLAATGGSDRLAAFAAGRDGAGLHRRRCDRRARRPQPRHGGEGRLAAHGLPRRTEPGRGVRLAAPGRPDLELLGEQLPARPQAGGVRRAVLERRHHPHECCTARRLRRRRPRQLHRPAEGAHRPGRARRPVAGRARHLPGRRRRRPPDAVGRLLPEHPVARRHEPVRPVHQRPHRRAGQPAGQPEGHLPGQHDEPARPQGVARRGGEVQGSWWPDAAAWFAERCGPERAAPEKLGGAGLEPLVDAPGTYVFDS